ncbi:MAG: dihydrofolate reductase family protein [Actinomycetota bacterium]
MRKLVVATFATLDGVMQGPGGPDEDREGGFEHGGWSVPYWDEMTGQVADEQMTGAASMLLGRKTYDIFVNHWPKVGNEDPMAAYINNVDKYVASRTMESADWGNTAVIRDVATEVARLKDQPGGEIGVPGSSNLIQSLLKHDLIDEFRIWTFPIVLGTGKRLFGDGALPAGLKLVDSKVSTTGVTMQTYERAGEPQYGSFALDS